MSKFQKIESQLQNVSEMLKADLSIDRPNYPEGLRTFEERRIDWEVNEVKKAIIIQPTFEVEGVNSEIWNFRIVAWNEGEEQTRKQIWTKSLVYKEDFSIIENNINVLLEQSVEELKNIQTEDLEPIKGVYLFLDLDGVLITTPSWKSDEIDDDGYSKFNVACVDNLNILLSAGRFQIWLSSSRRNGKTVKEFNRIFRNRKINGRITGFIPLYEDCRNRREELTRFISERSITKFIILDDDKSLNSLKSDFKTKLVLTEQMLGFKENNLTEAMGMIEKRT